MKRSLKWRTVYLIGVASMLVFALLAGCRSRTAEAPVEGLAPTEAATQAPTHAPTDAATKAPAETLEPERASEEAVSESVPESEVAATGACDHPFYPIRDGAVYRYQTTAPGANPEEMTIEYTVTGPDSFLTTQSFSGISMETAWQCTPGGLLRSDLGLGGMDIPGLEYTVDSVSGVTLPLPENMVEGAAWQNEFSMSGKMSMEGFDMTMNIQAVTNSVLVGFEQITTPAGTYDAAKVESTTTLDMSTDMGAVPAMPAVDTTSTMWLSEGVGMVKSVSADPNGSTSTVELVALE